MREAEIIRRTAETDIRLRLVLDGTGKSEIDTGCGFLNHMLTLFARHGRFDLEVKCVGDTDVDDHHSVEDIGICLGQAFAQALGELKLTVTGDRQILVENHRGLELVTQELIELKWNKGLLRLYGTGLLIAAASKEQLLVSGKLERIEWE